MIKILGARLALLCCFVCFSAQGLPKKVVLSDVMNASQTTFLKIKEVLESAYQEIGVEIEWVPVPTTRALMYSSSGEFDGELIRIDRVAKNFPSLQKVPVSLVETSFHLYCLRKDYCQKEDLTSLLIGYNKQIKLYELMCERRKLACYSFTDSERILAPLYQNKIEAFLAAGPEIIAEINKPGPILYQSKALYQDVGYHYLNKKHQALIAAITKVLEKNVKKGTTVVPLPIRFDTNVVKRVVPVE